MAVWHLKPFAYSIRFSAHFLAHSFRIFAIPLLLLSATTVTSMTTKTDQVLQQLGITLPTAPKPAANYLPCQRDGNLLYLSGHLPLSEDGTLSLLHVGCMDATRVETGYQAARQVGLNMIATIRQELNGDLDRVEKIVKVFGVVQSLDDFHEQHKVVNGCSDLFCQVFGTERGLHSRSAIGANALPLNACVEIEAIVRIRTE
jgi:enamine deaminase RidA (YjgF/YER057c/UK114 family)